MKRLLITVFALLLSIICLAQQQVAKVTLKNGAVLTGQVSALDPTSHVKLIVGGFETKINMIDVTSIENVKEVVARFVNSANNEMGKYIYEIYFSPKVEGKDKGGH